MCVNRTHKPSGSPAMYHLLLKHFESNRFDTSSITKCTVGSAILPGETKRRLEKYFPNICGIYDVYGCTEAAPSGTIIYNRATFAFQVFQSDML